MQNQENVMNNDFYLSTAVDFVDDVKEAKTAYTSEAIDSMMKVLLGMGIKRVYWIYYGDITYEMFYKNDSLSKKDISEVSIQEKTIESLQCPLTVAVKAAKRHGLEIYALIKPYETGISKNYPEGSPEAAEFGVLPRLGGRLSTVMRFVRENPQLRIRRKMPEIYQGAIKTIKLVKSDDSPTRIAKKNIEIWTSQNNYKYKKIECDFSFREEVEASESTVVNWDNQIITRKGDPVRVLYLDELDLTNDYILVTTNFTDTGGDFSNCGTDIIKAYDSENQLIPSAVSGYDCWENEKRDFREYGLHFDTGFGSKMVCLDCANTSGTEGFIALCRGKNEFLSGSLCEAYPEVKSFWLNMVKECLTAGVDGIDFRVAGHSAHTDEPFSYGFNRPVIETYRKRYGVNILTDKYDAMLLSELRGEFYTNFLTSASKLIRRAGKRVQLHLDIDRLRETVPVCRHLAYPWNIKFDWEKWLSDGIADEITFRAFYKEPTPEKIFEDKFAEKLISSCWNQGLPVHFNYYIRAFSQKIKELPHNIASVYCDGRFQSFILYETATFLKLNKRGKIMPYMSLLEAVDEFQRRYYSTR